MGFYGIGIFLHRPWSSLELCPLDLKGSSELLLACLSQNGQRIPQEQVCQIASFCNQKLTEIALFNCHELLIF